METDNLPEDSPIDITDKNIQNAYFDEIIGHISGIILSPDFAALHNEFLEKYYPIFEDTEENRLEYMDIYLEYVSIFENFLVEQLCKRMDHFDMQQFAEELSKDADFTNNFNFDEIFELLHSFNSFQAFKDLMLDYRRSNERKSQNLDFDSILITKPIHIVADETNLRPQEPYDELTFEQS